MAKATVVYFSQKEHLSRWSQQEVFKIIPVTKVIKCEIGLKIMK